MIKKLMLAVTLSLITAVCATAEDAKVLYEKNCQKCHGEDGKGKTKMGEKMGAKDYSDPKVQDALTDEAAFQATKEGFKDKEGKVLMKPSEGMNDDEIKAIVKHMRSFKK